MDSISPSLSNTVEYRSSSKTSQRRRDPNTNARKMQDLNGAKTRKKLILTAMVALQKKKQNPPPNEPRRWRNGRGPLRGRQPIAGTDNCNSNHGGVEGSQRRPPPPLTCREPGHTGNDSQQETGDLVWPSSQQVGGRAPLRPEHQHYTFPVQEETQEHKSKHSTGEQKTPRRKPEENPEKPTKNLNPETKTATRPKKTHLTKNSRVSGPKHTGKRRGERPDGRAWVTSLMTTYGLCH